MSYNLLRSRYAHDIEALLDSGEITEEEAQDMMEDWEADYGESMYDSYRDMQLEEAWANEM